MVSLVLQLEDGSVINVGLIGKEGMVGALAPLGATAMSGEARVQMTGCALRMPAGVLRTEAARNPDLMGLLLRYVQALFAQVSQSVACNGVNGGGKPGHMPAPEWQFSPAFSDGRAGVSALARALPI